jgi:hypothetical protein
MLPTPFTPHLRLARSTATAVVVASICLSGLLTRSGHGHGLQASAAEREEPPGEGILCSLAIFSTLTEVGKICFPSQDVETIQSFSSAASRLGDFMLANGVKSNDLAYFLKDQGGAGKPAAELCSETALELYASIKRGMSPERLRAEIDRSVARPGQPTWGTCF